MSEPGSPDRKREVSGAHGISAQAVNAVSAALVTLGARQEPLTLDDTDGYVDPDVANQLLEDAARTLGEDAIGLRVASLLPPGSLGLLDYALFVNKTWGAGLRMLARYYAAVSTRAFLELEERDDEAAVVLRRIPGKQSHRHWIELLFAVIVERAKQALDAWKPRRVELAHDPPAAGTDHAAWFGVPVQFGASTDRLVFDRALLAAPLRTGVSPLAETLEQRLASVVPKDQDSLVMRTRQAVSAALDAGTDLSIAEIARTLAMSTRTLQRSLNERSISYTDLLDGVRHARVVELLATDLSIAEIAARVGFADQSALFRAFRRWSGSTPRPKTP